jgi:hypothetical protein
LKTGKFTHADAGQMHLYCNYAKEHWTHGLPNKVMVTQNKTTLPDEKLLATELEKSRKLLESRHRKAADPQTMAERKGSDK